MKKIRQYAIAIIILFLASGFWALHASAVASDTVIGVYGTWVSLLPPLAAIIMALAFRQVLLALFVGIWMGTWLVSGMGFLSVFTTFFTSLTEYIVPATADADHMSIIIFSLLIGGIVGVITDNGGTRGIISVISNYIKTKVKGQLVTALMGFIIFFDDYANTMVVGNTMRPLTDKLKISRAKLAYLVDSTAAPVATIALISTWIGAMVGYIDSAEQGISGFNEAAYSVFIQSLPYNFYAFFTIIFVLMIAWSGRDFGPMLTSRENLYKAKHDPEFDEYHIYHEAKDEREPTEKVSHWSNAAIPILTLIFGVIGGLFITGEGSSVQDIVATADSYAALLWGSLLAVVIAILMSVSRRLLTIDEALDGMFKGMHVMFNGVLILVLAWALSAQTVDLGTADYLVSIFGEVLNPLWIPVLVMIISALTAFATGSSWGTMGILMPLVLPLAWKLGGDAGLDPEVTLTVIYASVSSVLAGSVWGDHCSPISDTTILSSIASQCDHVEHVRTQLPYATVGGLISIAALIFVVVFDIHWLLIYPAGIVVMAIVIMKFGLQPNPDDYIPE